MGVCLEKTSTSKKISVRRKIKPKRHTEIHVATEQSNRCIARYYKYVPGAQQWTENQFQEIHREKYGKWQVYELVRNTEMKADQS